MKKIVLIEAMVDSRVIAVPRRAEMAGLKLKTAGGLDYS